MTDIESRPAWVLEISPRPGGGASADGEGSPRRILLGAGEHPVGSAAGASVELAEPGVSRRHALLELPVVVDADADAVATVTDLGSKNGTFVDGHRVRRAEVAPGARLRFGPVEAVLVRAGDGDAVLLGGGPKGSPTARSAGVDDPVPSEAPSTEILGLVERQLAVLEGAAGEASAAALADALAAGWVRRLPVVAVEVGRDEDGAGDRDGGPPVVVARAGVGAKGEQADGPPDLDRTAGGWRLRLWTESPRLGRRLEPGVAVAVELLAARGWAEGPGPDAPARSGAPESEERGEKKTGKEAETGAADGPPTRDPVLRRRAVRAAKVARGDLPILLRGEPGVGKEVFAAWLHGASRRSDGPFLAVNCAALPAELLEAELFGIERGVATGVDARPGLLERAAGGTLFLDEIGDMAPALQAKLLRVLEGSPYHRVGGREALEPSVRFLAATNVDLEARTADGGFRADLHHRLAGFELVIPPLRERPEDVPALAARFLGAAAGRRSVAVPGLTRVALSALLVHRWPGNVRELRHEIERAVLLVEPGEAVDVHHLSPRLGEALETARRGDEGEDGAPVALPPTLEAAVREAERRAFRVALEAAGGDSTRAMELLGVSKTTWYRKLQEIGPL